MVAKKGRCRRSQASTGEVSSPAYTPTAAEQQAAQFVIDQRKKPPAPRYKVTVGENGVNLEHAHVDPKIGAVLTAYAFATGDGPFCDGLLAQLANVASRGDEVNAEALNYAMSIVRGIAPRDPTEALLAVQMAAVHNATIVAARRLANVETIDQQNSASTMLNKLARTFTTQMEALKKYRSSGEQTIKVQHVTVKEGGQAIVGTVNHGGGRGPEEKRDQSHELGTDSASGQADAGGPALLGQVEALGMPLPGTGCSGQEGLPVPRCVGGSAERES